MTSKWRLDGKIALITGSSRGIGFSIAHELAALGAEVVLTARNHDELANSRESLVKEGFKATIFACDLTDTQGRNGLIEFVKGTFGRLDVLVNSAGKTFRDKAVNTEDSTWNSLFNLNLVSIAELSRLLFPLLKKGKDANIVNISSLTGSRFLLDRVAYGTTKAALSHLTRSLAVEWAKEGIRVNAVSPWFTKTPMVENILSDPAKIGPIVARTPLGRVAEAEEIACVAAFLTLPAASYVTGQDILVDGGTSLSIF